MEFDFFSIILFFNSSFIIGDKFTVKFLQLDNDLIHINHKGMESLEQLKFFSFFKSS